MQCTLAFCPNLTLCNWKVSKLNYEQSLTFTSKFEHISQEKIIHLLYINKQVIYDYLA